MCLVARLLELPDLYSVPIPFVVATNAITVSITKIGTIQNDLKNSATVAHDDAGPYRTYV